MAAVWGDSNEEQARQNLRQCLSRLKRDLGDLAPHVLLIEGQIVALREERVVCDATEAAALSGSPASDDRERLISLIGGPFLEGFGRSSDGFEEWLGAERARFARLLGTALIGSAEEALANGHDAKALTLAERLVAMDPLEERAHRVLMVALGRCQGRSAALHHGERLAAIIRREFGCEPEPETQELVRSFSAREATGSYRSSTLRGSSPPSIAVMPFQLAGGDSEISYFAEGLTEDISAQLSRLRWLLVIGRQSTAHYGGRDYHIRQAAEEFGYDTSYRARSGLLYPSSG